MSKVWIAGVATVVGLAGAAAGASAWAGGAVLGELRTQTAELGKLMPTLRVVDEKVERGLFQSTHQFTLRFGCMPDVPALPGQPAQPSAAEPLELGVRTRIRHGPLLSGGIGAAALDSELVVPERWRARVDAVTGKQPPLRVSTKIGFDRGFVSDFTVPSLHFQHPEAGALDVDVIRAHASGKSDAASGMTYRLDMPAFAFHSRTPDSTLDVRVGKSQSETKIAPRKDPSLWLTATDVQGTLDQVEFAGSAAPALGGPQKPFKVVLEQLKFDGKSTLEQGLWSSSGGYAGQGRFNDFKIDRVELKAGVRRLHAATYQKLLTQLFEAAFSCEPAQRERGVEAIFSALERDAATLLVHNPEYGLDKFAVELGGQRGELSYSAGVRGVSAADAQRPLMDLVMTHGVLNARARVQLGLLDVIDRQLADPNTRGSSGPLRGLAEFALMQFADAGYVVRDGDAIESAVSYEQGKLLVNGKPPALPDLGAIMGGP